VTEHKVGTQEEWPAARRELLEGEKELTRLSDELTSRRRELPWVRVEKEYRYRPGAGLPEPRAWRALGLRAKDLGNRADG
jgi:predicted dithiol-disulfide oxidoreductase (DUF899 family)